MVLYEFDASYHCIPLSLYVQRITSLPTPGFTERLTADPEQIPAEGDAVGVILRSPMLVERGFRMMVVAAVESF